MLMSFNVYFEFNKLQVGVGVTLNEQFKIFSKWGGERGVSYVKSDYWVVHNMHIYYL